MKNKKLCQRYKELFKASVEVAQRVRADKGLMVWWFRGSDVDMWRLLRELSGIDKGSGFTDFSQPYLASYFFDFIEEANNDPRLFRLYSRKDLGPILIYQLTHHIRCIMPYADADRSVFEEIFAQVWTEFENLLYDENWFTATIYPLVNFYTETGWRERQQHKSMGVDEGNVIFPGSTFRIDDDFEIKQINFITLPLLDVPAETLPFRAKSTYRDFTGDCYVLEVQRPKGKSADSPYNLTSRFIGRPTALSGSDVKLSHRDIVDLPEYLLLALRLFKPGDVGIAPYRYISDYPRPLYVPDLYAERYFELAQVEVYDEAPYILDPGELDAFKELYSIVSDLLSHASDDLEHIRIAQRYFQYSYSHKLTDGEHLQDRIVSLVFALEALLLKRNENMGRLKRLGGALINDPRKNAKCLLEKAYTKVRNPVAHGAKPEMQLEIHFAKSLESYVRQTLIRTIGLAAKRGIRSKESLQNEIDKAYEKDKETRSAEGTERLRKEADMSFLQTIPCLTSKTI